MPRLTVLGSCGAWPEAGRACAGFLLSHHGFHVVLDLGYGAASRLFQHVAADRIDAVIVTHEHPDHLADVSALGRAWQHATDRRLPLHCTPGTLHRLAAMEPRPHPTEIFDVHELDGETEIGPFRRTTAALPHHVVNRGVRLTTSGYTLAYTGDTGPSPRLAELAQDADVLICEATLQGPPPRDEPRWLMTATEAGRLAATANVGTLLLTHFWPGSDRAISVAEARAEFDGEVQAADEGRTLR
ncbi:MBL fold metallo-hydrolase [Amycolatopsis ultiminotia]|uniref:MBL fold metallo-hydrolase n=1 Tax=Amycolatopsis ultiminotia TaxID=543629 RepID=A0ABP6VP53_9PSEU